MYLKNLLVYHMCVSNINFPGNSGKWHHFRFNCYPPPALHIQMHVNVLSQFCQNLSIYNL